MQLRTLMLVLFSIFLVLLLAGAFLYRNRTMIGSFLRSARFDKAVFHDAAQNYALKYRLFKPEIQAQRKYPLVLVLHHGGLCGTDNLKQLDQHAGFFSEKEAQKKYPSFVLVPQCPPGADWANAVGNKTPYTHYNQDTISETSELRAVMHLLEDLIRELPIDSNRIYVTGHSMGGSATWDLITRHPGFFAAAIPITGVSDTSKAKNITHLPVWAFSGELDFIAPAYLNEDMVSAINEHGGLSKYTVHRGIGHGCIQATIETPGLLDWIFAQKKEN